MTINIYTLNTLTMSLLDGTGLAILITATVAQLGLAVAIQVVGVLVIWRVIMGMTVQGWGNLGTTVSSLHGNK